MLRRRQIDPVRRWTLITLGACVVLMFFYLVGDRITPHTSQARVHATVVPIAAEVSGTVTNVAVSSNQFVNEGDLLFEVDRDRYQLAVETRRGQSAIGTAGNRSVVGQCRCRGCTARSSASWPDASGAGCDPIETHQGGGSGCAI